MPVIPTNQGSGVPLQGRGQRNIQPIAVLQQAVNLQPPQGGGGIPSVASGGGGNILAAGLSRIADRIERRKLLKLKIKQRVEDKAERGRVEARKIVGQKILSQQEKTRNNRAALLGAIGETLNTIGTLPAGVQADLLESTSGIQTAFKSLDSRIQEELGKGDDLLGRLVENIRTDETDPDLFVTIAEVNELERSRSRNILAGGGDIIREDGTVDERNFQTGQTVQQMTDMVFKLAAMNAEAGIATQDFNLQLEETLKNKALFNKEVAELSFSTAIGATGTSDTEMRLGLREFLNSVFIYTNEIPFQSQGKTPLENVRDLSNIWADRSGKQNLVQQITGMVERIVQNPDVDQGPALLAVYHGITHVLVPLLTHMAQKPNAKKFSVAVPVPGEFNEDGSQVTRAFTIDTSGFRTIPSLNRSQQQAFLQIANALTTVANILGISADAQKAQDTSAFLDGVINPWQKVIQERLDAGFDDPMDVTIAHLVQIVSEDPRAIQTMNVLNSLTVPTPRPSTFNPPRSAQPNTQSPLPPQPEPFAGPPAPPATSAPPAGVTP